MEHEAASVDDAANYARHEDGSSDAAIDRSLQDSNIPEAASEPPDTKDITPRRPKAMVAAVVVLSATTLALAVIANLGAVKTTSKNDKIQTLEKQNAELEGVVKNQNSQLAQQRDAVKEAEKVVAESQAAEEAASAAASEAAEAGTGPKSNGTFIVGEDMVPGQWRTEGSGFCYWQRSPVGDPNDIIDNGTSAGDTFTVQAGEQVTIDGSCTAKFRG